MAFWGARSWAATALCVMMEGLKGKGSWMEFSRKHWKYLQSGWWFPRKVRYSEKFPMQSLRTGFEG